MGIAVAVIYVPAVVLFALIGNLTWVWCIRPVPQIPFALGATGLVSGFAVCVTLVFAIARAVPSAPDLKQLVPQLAISIVLPLALGIPCAFAARFAQRGGGLQLRSVQYLAAFSGGVINGIWAPILLVLYLLRTGY
jgi:hypothetical protein